jgi:phospholipid-transporting ATPase
LKNLLFTHGREAYRRNAFLVCYIFYKNIVFVLPQFWYGFSSAFGGQPLYESWLYQLYNILFTAFPIMWYALFDEQYLKEELLNDPRHFKIGLKNLNFGKYRFWRWIFYGTCQTLMLQIIGFASLEGPYPIYDHDGQPSSLWITGTHIYGMVVIMANIKVWSATSNHTIYSNLVIFGSIASFYLVIFTMSRFQMFHFLFGLFTRAMSMPQFYFICIFFLISTAFTERLLFWSNMHMTSAKEAKQEQQAMLLQYKRAQDSAMMRKRGARNAVAIASGHEPVHTTQPAGQHVDEDRVDLGDWQSNDGGSFSDIDSEEEIRREKHRRRRLRHKRELEEVKK